MEIGCQVGKSSIVWMRMGHCLPKLLQGRSGALQRRGSWRPQDHHYIRSSHSYVDCHPSSFQTLHHIRSSIPLLLLIPSPQSHPITTITPLLTSYFDSLPF